MSEHNKKNNNKIKKIKDKEEIMNYNKNKDSYHNLSSSLSLSPQLTRSLSFSLTLCHSLSLYHSLTPSVCLSLSLSPSLFLSPSFSTSLFLTHLPKQRKHNCSKADLPYSPRICPYWPYGKKLQKVTTKKMQLLQPKNTKRGRKS